VQQRFSCSLDLRALQPLPGLRLGVTLEPVPLRAVRSSAPLPVAPSRSAKAQLRWPLQPGALNELELRCWRWSRLGLGALAIALLLALVALLQRLKIAAGFGPPQLPS
jgi:hypothetical protein